jgi:hypothetical protein
MPASGFSYLPESFMSARVGFYNFGWVDMGVPDLDRMMDIVQVGSAAAAHDCSSRIHLWSSALSNSKAQGTSKRSVAGHPPCFASLIRMW